MAVYCSSQLQWWFSEKYQLIPNFTFIWWALYDCNIEVAMYLFFMLACRKPEQATGT